MVIIFACATGLFAGTEFPVLPLPFLYNIFLNDIYIHPHAQWCLLSNINQSQTQTIFRNVILKRNCINIVIEFHNLYFNATLNLLYKYVIIPKSRSESSNAVWAGLLTKGKPTQKKGISDIRFFVSITGAINIIWYLRLGSVRDDKNSLMHQVFKSRQNKNTTRELRSDPVCLIWHGFLTAKIWRRKTRQRICMCTLLKVVTLLTNIQLSFSEKTVWKQSWKFDSVICNDRGILWSLERFKWMKRNGLSLAEEYLHCTQKHVYGTPMPCAMKIWVKPSISCHISNLCSLEEESFSRDISFVIFFHLA